MLIIYHFKIKKVFKQFLRGLVKFKKIREKLGLAGPHTPTPYPIFFLKHVQQKNNTEKHLISRKKDKSELGLDPPPHPLPCFFLIFFNLTEPQNIGLLFHFHIQIY